VACDSSEPRESGTFTVGSHYQETPSKDVTVGCSACTVRTADFGPWISVAQWSDASRRV
jgi:hypothetical protein